MASSGLQLCETLSVAVMTGVGTAVTAYGSSHGWGDGRGLGLIYLAAACALLGIAAGLRTAVRRTTRGTEPAGQPAAESAAQPAPEATPEAGRSA
ncbi:hypothetical protein ACH4PU_04190 [Streptomyces sp. NPDC021100]|uniref:hypothetical protein n=1 Tax=Streptomyces sp. NPDC021100 TaxID=3365114 RepID=UPI00379BDC53